MSVKIISLVWEKAPARGGALLALLALADYADDNGYAWPNDATLARKTRLSKRQVQRIIQTLSDNGLIAVRRGKWRGRSSEYLVLPEIIKPDILSSFADSKVDIRAKKGGHGVHERVTSVTPPIKNHQEPLKKPSATKVRVETYGRFAEIFGVGLTAERFDNWRQRFQGRDLHADLESAMDWLESNPKKGPKDRKKPWMFLTNWIRRSSEFQAANNGTSYADRLIDEDAPVLVKPKQKRASRKTVADVRKGLGGTLGRKPPARKREPMTEAEAQAAEGQQPKSIGELLDKSAGS